MAGGGGATAQSTLQPYQLDFHGLILRGYGGSSQLNWEGSRGDGAVLDAEVWDHPSLGLQGGADHVAGDVLTVVGSDNSCTLTILTVDVGGKALTVQILTPGTGYTTGVYTTTTSGIGTGCNINVTAVGTLGYDSTNTYADNPSILRFISEKGLTDVGGNPYNGKLTYAPDSELFDNQIAVDEYRGKVRQLNPITDWDSFISTVSAKISDLMTTYNSSTIIETAVTEALDRTADTLTRAHADAISNSKMVIDGAVQSAIDALSGEAIDRMVASYRKRALVNHLRIVNRFSGGMAEINAVNSSAFIFGLAMLEGDFQRDVDDFHAKVELSIGENIVNQFVGMFSNYLNQILMAQRSYAELHLNSSAREHAMIHEATREMSALYLSGIEANKSSAVLQTEVNRIKLVAKHEESEANLEIAAKDKVWDLTLFQTAGNVLSAVTGGAVMVPQGPSKLQSALGGAVAGMGQGAAMTGGNPIGVAIGGIGGLLAGLS